MPESTYTDVVLTWTAALGVAAYILYIHTQRTRSFLERRTLVLLYCMALLFFVRGFVWLSDFSLEMLEFLPATLLPLAMSLFVEGLLRRHLRFAFKIYVAAGTALFMTLTVFSQLPNVTAVLNAFGVFLLSVMAYLGIVLSRRHRPDLTEAENRFINAVAVAVAVGLPLAQTDFNVGMWTWAPLKLGSVGGLIFVYTCVRMSHQLDRKRIVFGELVMVLIKAALVAAGFLAITGGHDIPIHSYLAVAAAFILLFTITGRLRSLRIQNQERSFLRTLLDADISQPTRFIASLRNLPFMEEHLLLQSNDLAHYDIAAIISKLASKNGVCRRTDLREQLAKKPQDGIEASEQLLDILERFGMSHVCLIQNNPAMLLLVNLPQVAIGQLNELELGLVRKIAGLIEHRS